MTPRWSSLFVFHLPPYHCLMVNAENCNSEKYCRRSKRTTCLVTALAVEPFAAPRRHPIHIYRHSGAVANSTAQDCCAKAAQNQVLESTLRRYRTTTDQARLLKSGLGSTSETFTTQLST